MLENLAPDTLPRLLRRTTVSAVLAGVAGFVVAVLLGSAGGAVGVVVGVALAIINLRYLDRQIARVEIPSDASPKSIRKRLRGRTLSRLAVISAIAIGALFLWTSFGIGIVSGLVLYQVVFVANVFRSLAAQGGIQ